MTTCSICLPSFSPSYPEVPRVVCLCVLHALDHHDCPDTPSTYGLENSETFSCERTSVTLHTDSDTHSSLTVRVNYFHFVGFLTSIAHFHSDTHTQFTDSDTHTQFTDSDTHTQFTDSDTHT